MIKVLYNLEDGRVLGAAECSTLDSISLQYDENVEGVAIVDSVDFNSGGKYFYQNGNLVKDFYGRIMLTCDLADSDGDGMVELAADGSSVVTFTIKKVDGNGDVMSGDESVRISSTRGLLSALSTPLVNGQATFTLRSIEETVSIDVKVTHPFLGTETIAVQLVP